MTETVDIESIEIRIGLPALVLKPTTIDLSCADICDDLAIEYRVYFKATATGGCIVYGRYDRGWVVNPNGRWVIAEMTRRLTN